MIGRYRPHGPLRWLLDALPTHSKWDVIGSLGAEARCTTVPCEIRSLDKLESCLLLKVRDQPSPFMDDVAKAVEVRRKKMARALGNSFRVIEAELMSDLPELDPIWDDLESVLTGHVILDISCLPKRFFFYLLRRLQKSTKISTLIVTVTIPERYGSELSWNAGPWDFLPSFGREHSGQVQPLLIIAVGYQHLTLLNIVEEGEPRTVRLLFPFPSKPPGGIRNWEFVRNIEHEKKFKLRPTDVIRVNPQETSIAFDLLTGQCVGETNEVWLAPFGPKSISLAMALFALAREASGLPVSVGYNQPPAYSATYSIGVERRTDGTPLVHAYLVKASGIAFYTL